MEKEKKPLYNEYGQVNDNKIAREMADTEKPYREDNFKGVKKIFSSEKKERNLQRNLGNYYTKLMIQK